MRFIVAEGSFHEAGRQVGAAFAGDLPFVLAQTKLLLVTHAAAGGLAQLRSSAETYMLSTGERFPEAYEYLVGLSRGGGISLEDLALIAFSEEIMTEFCATPPQKCSTLAVPTAHGWLIGHNEDYEPQYYGRLLTVDLRIAHHPRTFLLTYPGHPACSLNEAGLAITNNSLWPEAAPGLSKNAKHFRAALAEDMEKALLDLAVEPNALTTHYTVGWGPGDELVSIEVGSERASRTHLAVVQMSPDGPFCHANHVLYLDLKHPDPAVIANNHSLKRYEKLLAIPKAALPRTPEALLGLLSTNDGLLHRTPAQNATSVTLASIVIEPARRRMWIRDADPTAAERDLYLTFDKNPLN